MNWGCAVSVEDRKECRHLTARLFWLIMEVDVVAWCRRLVASLTTEARVYFQVFFFAGDLMGGVHVGVSSVTSGFPCHHSTSST
jgi:hypothetical protein